MTWFKRSLAVAGALFIVLLGTWIGGVTSPWLLALPFAVIAFSEAARDASILGKHQAAKLERENLEVHARLKREARERVDKILK